MKFLRTAAFDRDVAGLSEQHYERFRAKVLPAFVEAAERAAAGEANPWPNAMRVKKVQGVPDVWEMTWSWDDPDGRATWQWEQIDGEPGILWRRCGTHDIFANP